MAAVDAGRTARERSVRPVLCPFVLSAHPDGQRAAGAARGADAPQENHPATRRKRDEAAMHPRNSCVVYAERPSHDQPVPHPLLRQQVHRV